MWPGGISVSAVRITPVSTPLRVRTSVVIAKAMMRRLATIPSRFQPIRFLKPRPSVVSSRCIRPPGEAATIESPSKGSMASGGQSVHLQRSIRQKRVAVQSLTTPASSFDRRGCHMPYICRHAQDLSLGPDRSRVNPSQCSLFHRDGFGAGRNNLGISLLARISNRTYRRGDDDTGGAVCSLNKKGSAMGFFTKDIKTMNDLFVHQLQDIYYAEKQLVKALPKMAEKATDKQLSAVAVHRKTSIV